MTIDEVLAYFGTRVQVTTLLGINRTNFTQWQRFKRIPKRHQLNLEAYTKGVLKADDDCKIQEKDFEYKTIIVKRNDDKNTK